MANKEVRNVYDLKGTLKGRRLWLVAPGPSSEALEVYGARLRATGDPVLVLNSAIEVWDNPTWWFYSDKRFSWLYGAELHGDRRKARLPTPRRVIVPHSQTKKMQIYFAGDEIYSFNYQLRITRYFPDVVPFWLNEKERFLPGRSSVLLPALSLAELLEPDVLILVGVDFVTIEGQYYNRQVHGKNPGPTYRERALDAGRNALRSALSKKTIWPTLKIRTTSPFLAGQVPVDIVQWEELLDGS